MSLSRDEYSIGPSKTDSLTFTVSAGQDYLNDVEVWVNVL